MTDTENAPEFVHYAVYDRVTGKIVSAGRSSNASVLDLLRERLGPSQALYEGEINPNSHYLPGGLPTEKMVSHDLVEAREVKAHARQLLTYTDWYITRQQETGAEMPGDVATYRQAVRDASGALEAMNPIPSDFRNQNYWPALP